MREPSYPHLHQRKYGGKKNCGACEAIRVNKLKPSYKDTLVIPDNIMDLRC